MRPISYNGLAAMLGDLEPVSCQIETESDHSLSNTNMTMNSLSSLIPEMVNEIFSYLEPKDLKTVRLVCRRLKTLASPLLFTKAYIAARRGVMDVFKQITSHPVLSNYIREIVYDASWFEPSVAASIKNFSQTSIARGVRYKSRPSAKVERREYETYLRLFDEQEQILSDELPAALDIAFKVLSNIRRVTFADFSRHAYILGDRAEDFGEAFHSRCNSDSWIHKLSDIPNLQRLARKFGPFKLLLKSLSASASLDSVECFSAGDGLFGSEDSTSSGIPHIFFSSKYKQLPPGVFHGLHRLRKLDLSIVMMATRLGEEIEVDALKELLNMADGLEELRLVRSFTYPLPPEFQKEPRLTMASVCGSKTWKNLRTLELHNFRLKSSEVLRFLRRHRHCLQKIDMDEYLLLDKEMWLSFCKSIHIEYPSLYIIPLGWSNSFGHTRWILHGTTDTPEGEAVPVDWAKIKRVTTSDEFDVDVDWIFPDQSGSYSDNESFTETVSTTSEELEFSAGSDDDSDLDSLLGLRTKD